MRPIQTQIRLPHSHIDPNWLSTVERASRTPLPESKRSLLFVNADFRRYRKFGALRALPTKRAAIADALSPTISRYCPRFRLFFSTQA
jgi:hypothetical protein